MTPPFWMTGEAWGHGVMQSDYYRHGFDAMINFDYQDQAAAVDCLVDMDATWQQMADKLQWFQRAELSPRTIPACSAKAGSRAAELVITAPGAVQLFLAAMNPRLPAKLPADDFNLMARRHTVIKNH